MNSQNFFSLKKSYKIPKEGDVFVLKPDSKFYYFGKVIKTNIVSADAFINGMNLIFIYDFFSEKVEVPDNLDREKLLIPPIIVNNQLWRKGYCEIIGNIPVTDKEKNVDYAFWNVIKNKYVDLSGKTINHTPQYFSIFGLGSYGIFKKEIYKAINKNN